MARLRHAGRFSGCDQGALTGGQRLRHAEVGIAAQRRQPERFCLIFFQAAWSGAANAQEIGCAIPRIHAKGAVVVIGEQANTRYVQVVVLEGGKGQAAQAERLAALCEIGEGLHGIILLYKKSVPTSSGHVRRRQTHTLCRRDASATRSRPQTPGRLEACGTRGALQGSGGYGKMIP